MECPNVHKISPSLVLHLTSTGNSTECWLMATKLYFLRQAKSYLREPCQDPWNLNKAIIREHHCLLAATDIFQEMTGAHYFTKLDASNTFWQIRVDEESFKLLTFSSSCGCFRFLCISYRMHSVSEACQACIAAIIESIEGCRNAQNDIIIWADTLVLFEKRIIEVLQAIRWSENWIEPSVNSTSVNWHSLDTWYPTRG